MRKKVEYSAVAEALAGQHIEAFVPVTIGATKPDDGQYELF